MGSIALLAGGSLARAASEEPGSLPREVTRIPLPGVAGRIDHLAVDVQASRLFVAALENGSLEAIDLEQNRPIASLAGFREPQGVAVLAGHRKLFVTNGEGGGVTVLEAGDLTRSGWIALRADPDNIRYEPSSNLLWVGEGADGSGALAALDPESGELVAEIPVVGHPESFQLETKGSRAFVNVPSHSEVAVIDRELRRVAAHWRLPCAANFPMALDEAHRRLFVGCRRPARVLVLDTETGTALTELDSPADADDIFVDAAQDRVYVSGGEGLTRVYARRGIDRFEVVGDLRTGPGARTSLFVPESHRLYVAVPRRGGAPAEIVMFETLQRP
jgi:DNA-binding beta-propeller fold protein YncE